MRLNIIIVLSAKVLQELTITFIKFIKSLLQTFNRAIRVWNIPQNVKIGLFTKMILIVFNITTSF